MEEEKLSSVLLVPELQKSRFNLFLNFSTFVLFCYLKIRLNVLGKCISTLLLPEKQVLRYLLYYWRTKSGHFLSAMTIVEKQIKRFVKMQFSISLLFCHLKSRFYPGGRKVANSFSPFRYKKKNFFLNQILLRRPKSAPSCTLIGLKDLGTFSKCP